MVLLIVFWMTIVLLCLAVMMIIWMYRTAKLERILYQDLYFDDLPTSFENSSFFLLVIYTKGLFRIDLLTQLE